MRLPHEWPHLCECLFSIILSVDGYCNIISVQTNCFCVVTLRTDNQDDSHTHVLYRETTKFRSSLSRGATMRFARSTRTTTTTKNHAAFDQVSMSDIPDHVVRHFDLCVPSDFVTFCPTRSPACGRMAFILKLLVSRHAYVTCSPAGDDRFSLNRPTSPNKLRFYHVRDIHVCSTYDRMCFVRIIFCWTEIVRWQLPVLTCLCIDWVAAIGIPLCLAFRWVVKFFLTFQVDFQRHTNSFRNPVDELSWLWAYDVSHDFRWCAVRLCPVA